MKTSVLSSVLLTATALGVSVPAMAQLDLPRVSPKATVSQTVGLTTISLSYCRPGVRGRAIWGGLVPYDEIWRTGANEATTITFSDAVSVAGMAVPAGTYAVFTIPGKEAWTVILSRDTTSWGSNDYKPADDVVRIKVTPRPAAAAVEWMTFRFDALGTDTAELVLAWERLELAVPIKVEVVERVLAAARKAVAESKPDDWRTAYRAAAFCLDAKVNLDEAGQWLARSLQVKPGYYNTLGKARLTALEGGSKGEAIVLAKKAIELARAADPKADVAQAEGLIAEWTK
jgi:hypothetical protein